MTEKQELLYRDYKSFFMVFKRKRKIKSEIRDMIEIIIGDDVLRMSKMHGREKVKLKMNDERTEILFINSEYGRKMYRKTKFSKSSNITTTSVGESFFDGFENILDKIVHSGKLNYFDGGFIVKLSDMVEIF